MDQTAYIPPGGPPDVERPSAEIFSHMGDDGIRRMIHDFYGRLEKSAIHELFPDDMQAAADRSADYFVGLCGGPQIFQQKYGHPRLRSRHLHFVVTDESRLVWLSCFAATLENAASSYNFPMQHMPGFKHFLDAFSAWMVNKI